MSLTDDVIPYCNHILYLYIHNNLYFLIAPQSCQLKLHITKIGLPTRNLAINVPWNVILLIVNLAKTVVQTHWGLTLLEADCKN